MELFQLGSLVIYSIHVTSYCCCNFPRETVLIGQILLFPSVVFSKEISPRLYMCVLSLYHPLNFVLILWDFSFSTYAKILQKTKISLTSWYANECVSGGKKYFFGKFNVHTRWIITTTWRDSRLERPLRREPFWTPFYKNLKSTNNFFFTFSKLL